MKDKVQLIKEEIESYKESMKGLEPHSDFRRGQITAYNHIIQFIDSLPEEPKCIYNRTLEERKQFCKYCSAFCTVRIEEEPASEDLEEEILCRWEDVPHTLWPKCPYSDFKNIARHFAGWQRHKDQQTIELAEDHAMLSGMNKMKDEMMENAVEGVIDIRKWPAKAQIEFYDRLPGFNVRTGDKVKIIIVKPEQQ